MMKTILSLALGMFLAACTADSADTDGSPGSASAGAGTQPPPTSASAAEVTISCKGEVSKQSIGASVGLRCVGGDGDGGTKCGGSCAAQDIQIRYEPPAMRCGSVDLFAWDGTSCKRHPTNAGGTMHCKGSDCAALFASEASCIAAYETCTAR